MVDVHPRLIARTDSRWRRLRPIAAIVLLAVGLFAPGSMTAGSPQSCDVATSAATLQPLEQELLQGINGYRRALGLEEVALAPSLRRAALWKSEDRMHGGPNGHNDAGRTWYQRLLDCGYYAPETAGETLAAVQGELPAEEEPQIVLRSWQASASHDQILTDPTFRVIGLGRAYHAGSKRSYWTADFGGEPE
jgi:uncharacterized protein YkwD